MKMKEEMVRIFQKLTLFDSLLLVIPIIAIFLMLFPPIREVATPLLFGGIVAYMLSPLINILRRKLHLPAFASMLLIYFVFIFLIILAFTRIVLIANHEVRELMHESSTFPAILQQNIQTLPLWSQSFFEYLTLNIRSSSPMVPVNGLPLIRNTLERGVYLFVFFITAFYLMKDKDKVSHLISSSQLYDRINIVLKSYLRGQLILIIVMTALTWLFLSFSGIRYAFLLSLFTGFAEVIPFIGPIVATALTISVVLVTGASVFGNSVFATAIVVAAVYFIFRHVEDFFIAPYVMGKQVALHPLVILFATLTFGKLFGFVGLLLGVPFVATYKVIIEHVLTKER